MTDTTKTEQLRAHLAARLAQNGCDSYGIFQFGEGTNANVAQGNGCNTRLLFQFG
ncbi:hypothetical protein [Nioella aestuarii]|uniref:hypothetical protein n=1 Tax=Nioella aestuarii TaxID=1662864 RepID=UPI003D7F667A